jgi:hypothetical protein
MQIKRIKYLFIAFLWITGFATSAVAQSAEDYFHGGAQNFIHADIQQAISEVQAGLNQYPDDPKLNALMQMLKEEQEKQQQQQQQNQNQQQQQDQNQDQQNQDEQEQQDQQQQNESKEGQNEEQDQQQSEGQEQGQRNPEDINPEELNAQQISKEDAEKILRALAQKEKELLKEFKKKKTDGSAKHDKDW